MRDFLELKDLSVNLEDNPIVKNVSLCLAEGQIGCLLGPSGCGKTTLLRAVAGFLQPIGGEVRIANSLVSDVTAVLPVEKRQVGMVFQDHALFPHLTVRDNIAFGLDSSSRNQKDRRIGQLAELLGISTHLDTYPHKLSGGQQQRVAVARAIAPSPRILLLDEPFASLDVLLREQIAREIRQVLRHEEITTLLVSHNQHEAFAMADVIGVMREGRLVQWSTAFDLYHEPATPYVADFVGEGVLLEGRIRDDRSVETCLGTLSDGSRHGFQAGASVRVLLRPDDVVLDDDSALTAEVAERLFRGANFLYTLILDNGSRVLSLVPSHHEHPVGTRIGIRIEPDHVVVFPENQVVPA